MRHLHRLGTLALAAAMGCAPDERTTDSDTGAFPAAPLQFAFPIAERDRMGHTVGFDHDPEVHDTTLGNAICTNYDGLGFPACYDEHHGTDFMLVGGFDAMDAGSATVRAAAAGVVLEVVDGNYDRCHADLGAINCDGHPMRANLVTLDHGGGVTTAYYHLMAGSMRVAPGETVACGDALALVGSSGISSAPHLHFQVEQTGETPVDPYAGSVSGPLRWWTEQGAPGELPGSDCPPE